MRGGVPMNELSPAMKNERRKAVKEILAKDNNITMWGAAVQLRGDKSFSGNASGINRYLRENFSDLFVSFKDKTDRRRKVVERLIAQRTGITMWGASSALAGHDGFPKNFHSVFQYLHNNFSGLFTDTVRHRNKSSAREQKGQMMPQPKEIMTSHESGEMEMLLGTCELLLETPAMDAERLTTIRLLFRLLREQYKTAAMAMPAIIAEQVAVMRTQTYSEQREGFKRMRKQVEDTLKEHKITNLTGDYMHFINRMMNEYEGYAPADDIGESISDIIRHHVRKANGSPH